MTTTFTNMNDMVSGGITGVNVCTTQWGADLKNLGSLINLANLGSLGTPLALVQQLASVGGIIPEISLAFATAGVSPDTIIKLSNPSATVTATEQAAMYQAMTTITGTTLAQVLQLFGVTTANINTMADLLNPYKIFPNSFQTLTVTGVNGVSQNIYINAAGTVNATIKQTLPKISLSSLT